jgi:hypothetical protein
MFFIAFEMSMNAAEYCQLFRLAFWMSDARMKAASIVLLPRRNPYCSGPRSE